MNYDLLLVLLQRLGSLQLLLSVVNWWQAENFQELVLRNVEVEVEVDIRGFFFSASERPTDKATMTRTPAAT